jgi:HSP20 family molecular chaperone IbpA
MPNSFAGGPKVYVYQPTRQATKPAPSTEDIEKTTPIPPAENQLTPKNKQVGLTDFSVIYDDRNVHIIDIGDAFTFSLDLPGIKSSDAKVELQDGVLRIEAERKFREKCSSKQIQHFLMKEQHIDRDKIRASLSDGVLTITVPKKPTAAPIAIPAMAEYPPEKSEDAKELRMALDLPGVRASDVKLELYDGSITLHAERKDRASTIDKIIYVDEMRVDPNAFKAFVVDGVLTITGYRKGAPEPKQIKVADAEPEPKHITVSDSHEAATRDKLDEDEIFVETVEDEK